MMVRSGWNSEYARKKFDVELDESDLRRIVLGFGIPIEAMELISLSDAFTILHTGAEIIARQTLVQHEPSLLEKLKAEARQLRDKQNMTLAGIKDAWEATQAIHREREAAGE